MSKKATNENREHIDESDDESKIDWSGLGDAWMIEYQKLGCEKRQVCGQWKIEAEGEKQHIIR